MIYNVLLALFILISAPKILWQVWRKGKRVQSLKERLGGDAPRGEGGIWIHAVSVGEVKAAGSLIEILRKSPQCASPLLLTTTTVAGMQEALRSCAADQFRYLPLDFSWTMRRWMRSFRPRLLLFIEGDLWPNLLTAAQKYRVKTALVSGKISEKSTARFRFFSFAARHLFGSLDLLLAQNEEYRARFATLLSRAIPVTGNLKLDAIPTAVDAAAVRKRFSLSADQKAITISCTHAPEEKELLALLLPLLRKDPSLLLFLAPRHPERFLEVASLLKSLDLPFCRWNDARAHEPLILVDTMGQLPLCYAVSKVTIVAGSFSSKVGGHNIFEPCLYGCPVLFGPHMDSQRELVRLVIQGGAGQQTSLEELPTLLTAWLSDPTLAPKALQLAANSRGSVARTIALLQPLLSGP